MKDLYIVKKGVNKAILRPNLLVTIEEFIDSIDNNAKFTWVEDTQHGIQWNKEKDLKRKSKAYLNYNERDLKSFVTVGAPYSGMILVTFESKISCQNLLDLINYAESIDCNLWQYKPKQRIIDAQFANNYGKRK